MLLSFPRLLSGGHKLSANLLSLPGTVSLITMQVAIFILFFIINSILARDSQTKQLKPKPLAVKNTNPYVIAVVEYKWVPWGLAEPLEGMSLEEILVLIPTVTSSDIKLKRMLDRAVELINMQPPSSRQDLVEKVQEKLKLVKGDPCFKVSLIRYSPHPRAKL